eukprot:UN34592
MDYIKQVKPSIQVLKSFPYSFIVPFLHKNINMAVIILNECPILIDTEYSKIVKYINQQKNCEIYKPTKNCTEEYMEIILTMVHYLIEKREASELMKLLVDFTIVCSRILKIVYT